ncbi:MAG: 2-C-methyl-D-erythritol 4-phosphate cytidylyltransferase, partial [Planctomycetes bacterium]|nr:2-C-methyl-D-erythritol 4-phosphate cytidylyltransferase [Planctomycetota bacterium]
MLEIYAVIMAGGGGTRFWPESRAANPKQFLSIVGDAPLITQTFDRLGESCKHERIMVITNSLQAPGTSERLPKILSENIIPEPVGRNTA